MGFEPTHKGTTILGLNRLTTSAISYLKYKTNIAFFQLFKKKYLFALKKEPNGSFFNNVQDTYLTRT